MVTGDFIGTDVTGTFAVPNTNDGIDVSDGASGNTIGIAVAGAGNVIGGNGVYAIEIDGSSNNLMLNNTIGMKADLSGALGNGYDGINIGNGSTANTIGGTGIDMGNRVVCTNPGSAAIAIYNSSRTTTLSWGTRSD